MPRAESFELLQGAKRENAAGTKARRRSGCGCFLFKV